MVKDGFDIMSNKHDQHEQYRGILVLRLHIPSAASQRSVVNVH